MVPVLIGPTRCTLIGPFRRLTCTQVFQTGPTLVFLFHRKSDDQVASIGLKALTPCFLIGRQPKLLMEEEEPRGGGGQHTQGDTSRLGKRKQDGTLSTHSPTKLQRCSSPQEEEEGKGEDAMEVDAPTPLEGKGKEKTKTMKNTTVQKEELIYVMAHNARSYDLHLILKGLYPHLVKLPTKIRNGQQILQVTLGRLCFQDSLNFIPYPLKAFPKSFGPNELKKGYIPHFFNTEANQTYRGPYPPAVMYDPDGMSPTERTAFLQWHTQEVQEGALFDLQEELLAYCQSDVDILRRGCADFRQNAIRTVLMDPFVEVMTAAAFTMKSFRKHDLKPILPPQGYQPKRNFSQACMHWLSYLMETDPDLHLQHARNGGEKEFTCGEGKHRKSVDGYDSTTGTIYVFLGCFWHGCQTCHKTKHGEPHPVLGTSMGARYNDTRYRLSLLNQHPEVKRVVTLWEHEFKKMQQEDSALLAFLQGPHCIHVPGPLNPLDAFYGGRTNATRLCYEAQEGETIKYIDICSLYPYICQSPTLLHQPPVDTLFELKGLIQCRVLPPKRLYHTRSNSPCEHTDEERSWVGTYPTIELHEAVKKYGYKVLQTFDVWHFDTFVQHEPDTQQEGLFDTYIDRHFKEKLEASRYPEGCTDHNAYIQEIYDKEGIRLDKDRIEKKTGLRTIAKLFLNLLLGKFGQRLEDSQNVYMNDPAQYFALRRDDRNTIEDVTVVNEHMMEVTYTHKEEFQTSHSHFNVAIAAWVTAQARLKLYETLALVGRRVLYFDTDSVIYIHRPHDTNSDFGHSLVEFTDELDGNTIKMFVSGGPKNHGFELMNPRPDGTLTTCKGFTNNTSTLTP
ncbi:uncharacterized protein LOC125373278 [Haliotis rufescens]|uniref:uncharacterized protein LOC125373278 n=1 Tax=Haliotis rufescens TaxID=6454 RepID=UPI00201FB1C2|nr:uncharacterized protein LOC125373278 [Haliotis rufescens]